jgi:hypothetical protein
MGRVLVLPHVAHFADGNIMAGRVLIALVALLLGL